MEETAGSSEGRRPRRSGDGKGADAVPGYLRPSAGSCHHVCKYGGAHTFEERDARSTRAAAQPRPRRQQQPVAPEVSQRTTAAPGPALAKLRSASSRRRVGDLIKLDKAGKLVPAIADAGKKDAGAVAWKDIVAYESSPRPEKITVAGDVVKTKGATKGKKSSHGRVKIIPEQVDDIAADKKQPDGSLKKKKLISSVGSKLTGKPSPPEPKAGEMTTPPPERKKTIKSSKSIKPPKLKKNLIEIQDKGGGEEIVLGDAAAAAAAAASAAASNIKEERSHNNLSQEEKPGRAPMAAAHRRAKSMSITSSKSVRFPFTRQASRTSAAFKVVRSKSTRAPATASPEEEDNEKPATRLRFIRRGDAGGSSGGGSIQLRIRSLRRRGSSSGLGGAAATAGFVVPAVALRHQKTLEKKRSRRLYNSVIEETAGKLAKARKSRVKALVGAFESLISKIGK